MKKVIDFEVVDHGIEHSQYFQGCGTSFTSYSQVVTGCGDNPNEALEDALDQIAYGHDIDTEDLKSRIMEDCFGEGCNVSSFPEKPSAYDQDNSEESEMYYYLSIRWNA